jgi:peptidoglycan/LPS O-acetylase OafA/YrhL
LRAVKSLVHRDVVPGLTGLRFVAAFCVLIAHSVTVLMGGYHVYWLRTASGFGMTLFFVLSGFVIHYNYAAAVTGRQAARGTAAFFWARFARLYPLLLLMLALYVLVSNRHFEFWTGRPERFIDVLCALPYFLLSIQSWLYLPIGETSLIYAIGPSASLTWSISTEWFFIWSTLWRLGPLSASARRVRPRSLLSPGARFGTLSPPACTIGARSLMLGRLPSSDLSPARRSTRSIVSSAGFFISPLT